MREQKECKLRGSRSSLSVWQVVKYTWLEPRSPSKSIDRLKEPTLDVMLDPIIKRLVEEFFFANLVNCPNDIHAAIGLCPSKYLLIAI